MPRTTYTNHEMEITVESANPVSLLRNPLGERFTLLLYRLRDISGVVELKAEQIGTGPPSIVGMTVVHDEGSYNDVVTTGLDGIPRLTWPDEVNDGWGLVKFARFMETRDQLRSVFAEFHPTLVEIIFY